MSGHDRAALGALILVALGFVLAGVDLERRREADAGPRRREIEIVEATGLWELALSSGARWLRHPALAEPAAGCAGPVCLDTDPAGLALPPARATFAGPVPAMVRVPE